MIARVSLEIALRKEFDYLVPPELVGQVDMGSRVQVPFGPRKVFGCVTGLAEQSAHTKLKPILRVIGAQTLVTPKVLRLARWMGDYYCCPPETALKSTRQNTPVTRNSFSPVFAIRARPMGSEFPFGPPLRVTP